MVSADEGISSNEALARIREWHKTNPGKEKQQPLQQGTTVQQQQVVSAWQPNSRTSEDLKKLQDSVSAVQSSLNELLTATIPAISAKADAAVTQANAAATQVKELEATLSTKFEATLDIKFKQQQTEINLSVVDSMTSFFRSLGLSPNGTGEPNRNIPGPQQLRMNLSGLPHLLPAATAEDSQSISPPYLGPEYQFFGMDVSDEVEINAAESLHKPFNGSMSDADDDQ